MFQKDPAEVRIRPALPEEAPVLSALALRSKGVWGCSEAFLEACRAERNGELAGFHAVQIYFSRVTIRADCPAGVVMRTM